MTCTHCGQPIEKGEHYHKTKKGFHHHNCLHYLWHRITRMEGELATVRESVHKLARES